MAIDKRNSKVWVKVVIAVVALAFGAGPIVAVFGLFNGNQSGAAQPAAGGYAAIAQRYAGSIAANDQALASDPASYTVLISQGNLYYDWGAEVRNDQSLAQSRADLPMWTSAAAFYERALEVKAGDPNVGTDLAIAYYYGGRTTKAVETIDTVLAEDPEFAPALFNGGAFFYPSAGETDKAIAALEKYLELDPAGNSGQPELAQQALTELKGTSAPTSATPLGEDSSE